MDQPERDSFFSRTLR